MALKDKWVDKVDGVDIASAEDINQVASAVIELENQVESGGGNGKDGFSPIVSVVKIDGGNRVVITDAKGDNTFDVMDGVDGKDGKDGYTPVKGVDYWTDEDVEDIKAYVDEAILGGVW